MILIRKCVRNFLLVRHCDYGRILHRFCLFFLSLSHSAPSLSMPCLEFRGEFNREETRVMGLSVREDCMILAGVVLTWYQRVTDSRTESKNWCKWRSSFYEGLRIPSSSLEPSLHQLPQFVCWMDSYKNCIYHNMNKRMYTVDKQLYICRVTDQAKGWCQTFPDLVWNSVLVPDVQAIFSGWYRTYIRVSGNTSN